MHNKVGLHHQVFLFFCSKDTFHFLRCRFLSNFHLDSFFISFTFESLPLNGLSEDALFVQEHASPTNAHAHTHMHPHTSGVWCVTQCLMQLSGNSWKIQSRQRGKFSLCFFFFFSMTSRPSQMVLCNFHQFCIQIGYWVGLSTSTWCPSQCSLHNVWKMFGSDSVLSQCSFTGTQGHRCVACCYLWIWPPGGSCSRTRRWNTQSLQLIFIQFVWRLRGSNGCGSKGPYRLGANSPGKQFAAF